MTRRFDRDELIATPLLALLALVGWACTADAASRPAQLQVPGTITLTFVNPPQPVSCITRGWQVHYIATGAVIHAHSAQFTHARLVLDLTPAADECIHVDGFESAGSA